MAIIDWSSMISITTILSGGTLAVIVGGIWRGLAYLSGINGQLKRMNRHIAIMNHNSSLQVEALVNQGILTAEVVNKLYNDPDMPTLEETKPG